MTGGYVHNFIEGKITFPGLTPEDFALLVTNLTKRIDTAPKSLDTKPKTTIVSCRDVPKSRHEKGLLTEICLDDFSIVKSADHRCLKLSHHFQKTSGEFDIQIGAISLNVRKRPEGTTISFSSSATQSDQKAYDAGLKLADAIVQAPTIGQIIKKTGAHGDIESGLYYPAMLRNLLNEKIVLTNGTVQIEKCDMNTTSCKFDAVA